MAAILNTRNDAQTAYFYAKDVFDARVHPPGEAPVNQRRLATAIQELERTWQIYEAAQIVFMNRYQFATDEERVEANTEFRRVHIGFHDDVDEAREIMEQFEAAAAPQQPPVLTEAQKLERLGLDMENRQNAIQTRAEAMEISLAD